MSTPTIKHLDSLLQKYLGKDSRIVDHTIKYLLEEGDNYGSRILSVVLKVEQCGSIKEIHAIAKCPTESEVIRSISPANRVAANELNFYENVVPAITALQKEHGIPEDNLFENMFPKLYGGRLDLENSNTVDEDSVIIIENLTPRGYKVGDRIVGYDLEESLFVLKYLARFHCAGVASKLLQPEEFKTFVKRFRYPHVFSEGCKKYLQLFAKEVKVFYSSFNDLEQYAEKAAEQIRKLCYFAEKSFVPDEPFASIVHSDFWINNILLLKKNDKLTNIKIVDFQFCGFRSPAEDVLFFCYGNINGDVLRERSLDYFLDFYYDCFIDSLKEYRLDTGPFSKKAYRRDIDKVAPVIFGRIVHTLQVILTDNEKMKKLNLPYINCYTLNKVATEFFKRAENLLREYLKRGWLK